MELRDAATGALLSRDVERAITPWQRTIGLLRASRIDPSRGVWFDRCRAVHTMGMRSAIDVILLDAQGVVVALEAGVRPNRPYVSGPGTRAILEMGPGFLAARRVRVGDRLELVVPEIAGATR